MALSVSLGAVLSPGGGLAQIVPPGSTVEGMTIGEWGGAWWGWALSLETPISPATDLIGCFQNRGQAPPVFFMCSAAGAAGGGPVTRTFTVPEDQHLLVGLSTGVAIPELGEDPTMVCQDNSADVDQTTSLSFSLDGIPIPQAELLTHRESSGFFAITAVAGNPFGIPEGTWENACVHGFFVMVEPLALGLHTIHCGFTHEPLGLLLHHTNVITVVRPLLSFVGFDQNDPDPGGVDGLGNAQSVAVSPDGNHVYVASSFDDAIAVFQRSAATGTLAFVEVEQDGMGGVDGLNGAQAVVVSPDGQHVYAAASEDDALAVFQRDGVTGALTFVEVERDGVGGVVGLDGATAVALSPGGEHVYAAGLIDDSVASFERDAATGALSFVGAVFDGGPQRLNGPKSLAVSPDGAHAYVALSIDHGVAVFERDAVTGALSYLEAELDGAGGVDGLEEASAVAVSPAGDHVYVAASFDDALTVFQRDAATGALTFVEFHQAENSGTPGLFGAGGVAVSPDGSHVFATSFDCEALTLFERDVSTGALTFVDLLQDDTYGVDGMAGPRGLAISPDGRHVYVAGSLDNAVATVLPEPDGLLLLLSGIAFLAILGRRRSRAE